LFRSWRCRWEDVDEFDVLRPFGLRELVVFRMAKGHTEAVKAPAHPVLVSGCDGCLPDTYRMHGQDLARLLNGYRDASRAAEQ
jgi:hypothetical protein